MLGHFLLVLLAFGLVVFNEVSGFFFQNVFYGYSFIFYFILLFITIQHHVLYASQNTGADTGAGLAWVHVSIKPGINLLWLGGVLLLVGTSVAVIRRWLEGHRTS